MEKKLYFLSALVLAGIILGFVPSENEKIKVSVIHYENGQVTVQDTVFDSSSGYSVEDFLSENGYDAETTEIINTDNFEGKYFTEFKTHNTFEFSDFGKSSENQNYQFAFEFDEEDNGKHESISITKSVDENGNVSVEKWVNGEEVEVTEEELAELTKQIPNKAENIFINCDSSNTKVKVMKWNDAGQDDIKILLDKAEMKEGGELGEYIIVEEIEDGEMEVIVESIVTEEISEEAIEDIISKWDTDVSEGLIRIKTIKPSKDGEEVDVEVIINDEKIKLDELSDDVVIETTAPKAYIIKSTSESTAPNATEDLQIEVITVDAPKLNTTELDEIQVMKFEIATEFDAVEPMFMKTSESSEPHTIALVSRITDSTDEDDNDEVEVDDFQINQDQVTLPIEDLQFFPNPTDGDFRMSFFLPQRGETSIYIYDANGKEVLARNLGNFQGAFNDDFDLSRFESGTYILNIVQNNLRLAEKIIVN